MPSISPPTRFLLRAFLGFCVFFALWWFLLLNPLMAALRISAAVPLRLMGGTGATPIEVTSTGDWAFQVPGFGAIAGTAQSSRPRSIQYPMSRLRLNQFTLWFPLYFTILAAAPAPARRWRVLLLGPLLLWVLAIPFLLLFAFGEIENKLHLIASPVWHWLLTYGGYISSEAFPYAAPPLIALVLHDELRAAIFSSRQVAGPSTPRARRSRAR